MLKNILQWSIRMVVFIHFLMLVLNKIPFAVGVWGLAMQLIYYQYLENFPTVNHKSFLFGTTIVGAFFHKWLWFTSLANSEPVQTDTCFCSGSVCFCAQPIIFLFTCVWLVPFILVVACEPIDTKKHDPPVSSDHRYQKSDDKKFLENVTSIFSKQTSQSLRRLLSVS